MEKSVCSVYLALLNSLKSIQEQVHRSLASLSKLKQMKSISSTRLDYLKGLATYCYIKTTNIAAFMNKMADESESFKHFWMEKDSEKCVFALLLAAVRSNKRRYICGNNIYSVYAIQVLCKLKSMLR